MGNQLVNSMVRGFGFTLGRKAANAVTAPRQKTTTPEPVNFSKKQLELIGNLESIRKQGLGILADAEVSFKDGRMTETEFQIIKYQVDAQIAEVDAEIDKLKSVSTSKGSVWPTVVGVIIGIYAVLWMLKAIKGL